MFHLMADSGWVTQHNSSTRSPIMSWHPMTKRQWVTHCFISLPGSPSIFSHPMTNRKWVTLLYFFARQSHQSCLIPWPTESEWHCFMSSMPGSLINHVSSYDQKEVSDYFFARHCLINHVSSHAQQQVSDTALFPCQAVSSIMPHPMTNRKWVTLLNLFARSEEHTSELQSP